jgi:nitrogen-specific signal transduction histidine kinase/ActR/RegA family two-component response regulator
MMQEVSKSVRVKHLEKKVEQLTLQLRDYNKVKDQLAQVQKRETLASLSGGIAHDFNNILHCILGYTEVGLLEKKNGSTDPDILKQIQAVVEKGKDLAQRFLVFGRKSTHRQVKLNFNTIVEEVQCLLLRTTPRNITIENKLASDLSLISGDAGQCEQIVMNLCINAIDAMPRGGKLLITTENLDFTENSSLQMKLGITPGSYVHMSVSDTGIGMSEDVAEYIFEPFYTTKEEGRGSGLGLSIVSSIIESHGGYIDCTSMPGLGTTFDIYIPAVNGGYIEKKNNGEKCFMGNSAGGEIILFVEDEEAIMKIGKHFLERYGYGVLTAKNSEEGLEVYQNNPVDFVIMDVGLPGRGGIGFLESLKSIDAGVKVLAISGYSASHDIVKELGLKKQEFLQKPFSGNDLSTRVRVILDNDAVAIAQMDYQDDIHE